MQTPDDLIGIDEAAALTSYTKGYLYRLVCLNEVPYYKQRSRLRFSRKELLSWLSPTRVPTNAEIDSIAALHTRDSATEGGMR